MTDGIARDCLDAGTRMSRLLDRFVIDESGNDLVEYALITGLVALLTIPALNGMQSALKTAYEGWNAAMLKCWRMPAPGTGGGCGP